MRIIFEGHEAFSETKKLLKSAKKKIWVCMYMIRFDERTKEIWRILEEKYDSGVDVTVWYDLAGCLRNIPRLSACPFARAYVPKWYRLGARNHAKVMIIDGKKALISGRNWTRRYYDEWVDTSIILQKEENVKDVILFSKHIEQGPVKPLRNGSLLRYTDPLIGHKGVYNFVLEHIVKSQKRIMLASPYFVIDDAIEELLRAAMDRGVKVTVIVPKKPEHRMAATFNRINFQRIHHKNLHVMRSQGMFHSKVMLFDDVALVGSANFDNRSFKLNTELSVVLGKKHVKEIEAHLDEVADHSLKYSWIQRTYDSLLFHLTRHLMELL